MEDRLKEIRDEVEAKGWPTLSQDPDLCMERACEFVGKLRAYLEEQNYYENPEAFDYNGVPLPSSDGTN